MATTITSPLRRIYAGSSNNIWCEYTLTLFRDGNNVTLKVDGTFYRSKTNESADSNNNKLYIHVRKNVSPSNVGTTTTYVNNYGEKLFNDQKGIPIFSGAINITTLPSGKTFSGSWTWEDKEAVNLNNCALFINKNETDPSYYGSREANKVFLFIGIRFGTIGTSYLRYATDNLSIDAGWSQIGAPTNFATETKYVEKGKEVNITFTWTAAQGGMNNNVSYYQIFTPGTDSHWTGIIGASNTQHIFTHTFNNVTGSGNFNFELRAYGEQGDIAISNPITIKGWTPIDVNNVNLQSTKIYLDEDLSDNYTLSWGAATGGINNPVKNYRITDGGNLGLNLSYTTKKRPSGETLTYTLTVEGERGDSYSKSITLYRIDLGNFNLELNPNEVFIDNLIGSWSGPEITNTQIVGVELHPSYVVKRSADGQVWNDINGAISGQSFIRGDEQFGQNYQYKVVCDIWIGENQNLSDIVTIETGIANCLKAYKPNPITSFIIGYADNTYIDLNSKGKPSVYLSFSSDFWYESLSDESYYKVDPIGWTQQGATPISYRFNKNNEIKEYIQENIEGYAVDSPIIDLEYYSGSGDIFIPITEENESQAYGKLIKLKITPQHKLGDVIIKGDIQEYSETTTTNSYWAYAEKPVLTMDNSPIVVRTAFNENKTLIEEIEVYKNSLEKEITFGLVDASYYNYSNNKIEVSINGNVSESLSTILDLKEDNPSPQIDYSINLLDDSIKNLFSGAARTQQQTIQIAFTPISKLKVRGDSIIWNVTINPRTYPEFTEKPEIVVAKDTSIENQIYAVARSYKTNNSYIYFKFNEAIIPMDNALEANYKIYVYNKGSIVAQYNLPKRTNYNENIGYILKDGYCYGWVKIPIDRAEGIYNVRVIPYYDELDVQNLISNKVGTTYDILDSYYIKAINLPNIAINNIERTDITDTDEATNFSFVLKTIQSPFTQDYVDIVNSYVVNVNKDEEGTLLYSGNFSDGDFSKTNIPATNEYVNIDNPKPLLKRDRYNIYIKAIINFNTYQFTSDGYSAVETIDSKTIIAQIGTYNPTLSVRQESFYINTLPESRAETDGIFFAQGAPDKKRLYFVFTDGNTGYIDLQSKTIENFNIKGTVEIDFIDGGTWKNET